MSVSERLVRHVRLSATSKADVRSFVPRLEDALRCASLPDVGTRLYIVRKLALGRVARDASAQQLSRVIEQRVGEVGGQWVAGGTAAAEHASFVDFSSSLTARVQLALRLVRDEPCTAWYWPLAVPEFHSAWGTAGNLQRIFNAVAQLPEARVALPAWSAQLVLAGAARYLVAIVSPSQAESLLQQIGIALPEEDAISASLTDRDGVPHASSPIDVRDHANGIYRETRTKGALGEAVFALQEGPESILQALPRWLRALLIAGNEPEFCVFKTGAASRMKSAGATSCATALQVKSESALRNAPADAPAAHRAATREYEERGVNDEQDFESAIPQAERLRLEAQKRDSIIDPASEAENVPGIDTQTEPYLAPSACAGLFFLLPVLQRLGLLAWAGDDRAGEFARRALVAALSRLHAGADDPAWALMPPVESDRNTQAIPTPAPTSWADALLSAPRTSAQGDRLHTALSQAPDAGSQAEVWLIAARRWLRRAGGIGLASLVLRPGRVSTTPTHIDIHFRLNDMDIRVRRLGLDIDPGWLPWFGRVLSFHYVRSGE
ncbi:MAG: hypothetical protein JWL63_2261 [Rhodocyclales bacterium]|nr:hypothetical protein [Rhodocyclales bacterium]